MKSLLSEVVVVPLKRHSDNRGYFSEVWKLSSFGKGQFIPKQMSSTISYPGVIKAFHWHKHQTDLWFCPKGNIEIILSDKIEGIMNVDLQLKKICMGENNPKALLIPAGLAHGYRVLGNEPANLVYLTDQEYDPNNPDEQRIPWDAYGRDIWETENR